jgi:hypothetical protein
MESMYNPCLSVFSVSNNTGVSFSMLYTSSPYAFCVKLGGMLPNNAALCNIRIGKERTTFSARKRKNSEIKMLNGANEVLSIRTITVGLVDEVLVHPREVFAVPITDRATAVILAHNPPSGDVSPSEHDKKVTQYLKNVGKFLRIQLLDHIIFSDKDHYSALENGEL